MYMSLYVYMCACAHSIRKHQVGSLLAFTAALYQIESCIFELASSVIQPSVILAGTVQDA